MESKVLREIARPNPNLHSTTRLLAQRTRLEGYANPEAQRPLQVGGSAICISVDCVSWVVARRQGVEVGNAPFSPLRLVRVSEDVSLRRV